MRQELERALEAIESACKRIDELKAENKTLKEALAQPEQEPVAYLSNKRQRINIEIKPQAFVEIPTVTDWEMPLYMKPPQRTWVGLTDEEIADCAEKMEASDPTDSFWREFFRGIEVKLKEKNT